MQSKELDSCDPKLTLMKIAEGVSDFGDFKAILFKTADGRHFIRYIPLNRQEKPYIEWLSGNDHLEWLRRLAYNQHVNV